MKNPLKTKFADIELKNPIIISSSGLTGSIEKIIGLEKAGASAVVLPSLFEEQISMEARWMTENSDFPEAKEYMKGFVENNSVKEYLALIRGAKNFCNIPVIASINCYNPASWTKYAKEIENAGADALEINVMSIETEIDSKNSIENKYISILKEIKECTNIPVIIKLSKYFHNIVALISQLNKEGANGIVLFNKLFQPDIDVSSMKITSGSIFSSHSDLYDTLRWTGIVSGKLSDIDIAASNGIHEWEDVIKCILAGAKAVEICSAIYRDGYKLIPRILDSIEEWMDEKGFSKLNDFAGRLSSKNKSNLSIYERAQFLKYFSDTSQNQEDKYIE